MNSSDELNNEMLTAYFDGELSQAEQLQVEQALFDNPMLRQQLRDWAKLRDALQGASDSHVIGVDRCSGSTQDSARGSEQGSNSVSHDAGRLEKKILDRIASAMAAGQVSWAATAANQAPRSEQERASSAAEIASGASAYTAASNRAADVKNTSAQDSTASVATSQGGKNSSGGGWLSDYRRLSPTQRLRRWQWQFGAIFAVAAGLLLTVFVNRNVDFLNLAYKTSAEEASKPRDLSGIGGRDLMVASAPPVAPVMPSFENPMPEDLAPSTEMAEFGVVDGNPVALMDDVTNFISYDVADPELGLQQMQQVLAGNKMTPVEVFEEFDSPVVVLSGEVQKLVEVLEAFEAAGDNSLVLLAKVGSDTDSALATNMFQNFGGVPSEMDAMNSSVANQSPPALASEANVVGEAESRQDQSDSIRATQDSSLDASAASVPPSVGQLPGQATGGQASGEQFAGGLSASGQGQQIASINSYRQGIIRSQANVLSNSMTPPANVTIEEFLKQRPAQVRPRVPFGRQFNSQQQSERGEATPSSEGLANKGLAVESQTSDAASNKLAEDSMGDSARLANNQQRAQQQTLGSAGEQAPGNFRGERGSGNPSAPSRVNSMYQAPAITAPGVASESHADSGAQNPSKTQIVVILRPRSRGQQLPAAESQNQR